MSEFIQIHVLTSYPPSNLNRDDLGRPKTAMMGGKQRLRISSQSLKRAWRTSDLFQEALSGHLGVRTKEMGIAIFKALTTGNSLQAVLAGAEDKVRKPLEEKKAFKLAQVIAGQFGKLKKAGKNEPKTVDLEISQLAHFSPEEVAAIDHILADPEKGEKDIGLLRKECQGVDIALFGRMMAEKPEFSIEAAAQVAHAISVHTVVVEDDYFTAVDDLNNRDQSAGSSHIGEVEFGAGVFYLYVCVNKSLLLSNLGGNEGLANRALKALVQCIGTVSPSGKQNSFASRAYASYMRVEKGSQQPRSLAVAFLEPVSNGHYAEAAITALEDVANRIDSAYGKCFDASCAMNVLSGEGSLEQIKSFIEE